MINIIIPTHKPKLYLFECLKSISNQSFKDLRVLIILNGVRDPFYDEILTFISKANLESRTELIYTELKGVSNARNIGLDMVRYEDLVIFIDDDDFLSSNYVTSLFENLMEKDSLSICNCKVFIESAVTSEDSYLSKRFPTFKSTNNPFRVRSFFSVVWGKLIPMRVINKIRFNARYSNGEDALFMASIVKNINKIYFTPPDTIYYRRLREGSASQAKHSSLYELINSSKLFCSYLDIHLSNPLKNNFLFFMSRYVAVFKSVFTKPF